MVCPRAKTNLNPGQILGLHKSAGQMRVRRKPNPGSAPIWALAGKEKNVIRGRGVRMPGAPPRGPFHAPAPEAVVRALPREPGAPRCAERLPIDGILAYCERVVFVTESLYLCPCAHVPMGAIHGETAESIRTAETTPQKQYMKFYVGFLHGLYLL